MRNFGHSLFLFTFTVAFLRGVCGATGSVVLYFLVLWIICLDSDWEPGHEGNWEAVVLNHTCPYCWLNQPMDGKSRYLWLHFSRHRGSWLLPPAFADWMLRCIHDYFCLTPSGKQRNNGICRTPLISGALHSVSVWWEVLSTDIQRMQGLARSPKQILKSLYLDVYQRVVDIAYNNPPPDIPMTCFRFWSAGCMKCFLVQAVRGHLLFDAGLLLPVTE